MLFSPQILVRRQPVIVAAAASATTWNNSDKSSSKLVLSNSNRTVTYNNTGNTDEGIRSVATTTTNQKVYIEHVAGTGPGSGWMIGFAVVAAPLQFGVAQASPSLGFGFFTGSGIFYDADSANHVTACIPSLTVGDRIGIAFDTGALKTWARKNGGSWNPSIGGAQDPAAGTGGVAVVMTGSPYYAFVGMDAITGDVFTTNFASSNWADAAPSGYTQLA
jgi:hypothetical protein